MNRRQKIIVSVTGIFLVLLVLVGLTYAFFVTRIRGNNNPTSISVTTANLELVYQDADNGDIIGKNMIIEPNSTTPIGEKTFTVTNNGNATIDNYAVIIENLAVKYVETQTVDGTLQTEGEVTSLVNGEDGSPDMKLVITCESNVEGKTCNGMNGYLPEKSGILLTNTIEEEEIQTYKATLTYLEDGTNQSDDMNKTIEGRFNIIDTNNTVDIEGTVENSEGLTKVTINSEYKESVIYPDGTYKFVGVKPDIHTIRTVGTDTTEVGKISIIKGESENIGTTIYNGVEITEITMTDESRTVTIDVNATANTTTVNEKLNPYNSGTLAYNIYKNASNATGEMTALTDPITLPLTSISGENERVLSSIEDLDGTSYFFRGNVIDNYVTFSNMCWKAVRIQGDKSVKLILEDESAPCEESSTSDNNFIHIDLEDGYQKYDSIFHDFSYITLESISSMLSQWLNNEEYDGMMDSLFGTKFHYSRNIDLSKLGLVNKGINSKVDEDLETEVDGIDRYKYNARIEEAMPSLNDENNISISLLTADELLLAGLYPNNVNNNFYLKDYSMPTANYSENFIGLGDDTFSFYSLNLSKLDILRAGSYNSGDYQESHITPVIALKENVSVTTKSDIGQFGIPGSKTNPYVVN